ALLAFLAARALPGIEEVVSGAYRRTFVLGRRHGILEVRNDPDAEALEARVRFHEPVSLMPIVTRIRAMFDVAANAAAIALHFRRDGHLAPLVRRTPGLRVPGGWDPFEMAVREILDEPSPAILELVRRHAQPLGLTDARSLTAIFPAADVLARMRLEWLPPATARTIRMVSANSDRI